MSVNTKKSGKPNEPGIYLTRCFETNYEWTSVIVSKGKHGLMVHHPYVGTTLLDVYHDKLTEIEWKPAISTYAMKK